MDELSTGAPFRVRDTDMSMDARRTLMNGALFLIRETTQNFNTYIELVGLCVWKTRRGLGCSNLCFGLLSFFYLYIVTLWEKNNHRRLIEYFFFLLFWYYQPLYWHDRQRLFILLSLRISHGIKKENHERTSITHVSSFLVSVFAYALQVCN